MIDKCVCKEWEGGGIAPKPAENHVVHLQVWQVVRDYVHFSNFGTLYDSESMQLHM